VEKKNISRTQIINTALNLMRNKNDLRAVNLREIARTLGCAHTNIYNYFSSYTDLLWETHTALQEVFMDFLQQNLSAVTTPDMMLRTFFDTFLQFYLSNTGWFRLAWLEYIGNERPEINVTATEKVRNELNQYIIDIWKELTGKTPYTNTVNRVMHNTHCYIVGEVSNYISGRRLIDDELDFKEYVVEQAIDILTLCLQEE